MNKIALFTVIYPGAELYIGEFIDSISSQTQKKFDLVIVNDSYKDKNLQTLYPWLNIIELEGDNSISINRSIGINYAIENVYDYLLLCDVDDFFKPTRVQESIKYIEGYDILVNDLDIVTAEREIIFKDYFQKSINKNMVLDIDFIEDKNIFGFSNTALRISSLHKIDFPSDLLIIDWYYFTLLLQNGCKARFLPKSLTEYRQHSGNMIGISLFTLDKFKNMLKFKLNHYAYLKDTVDGYLKKYNEMIFLSNKSDIELEEIIKQNTTKNPYPLWWQNIKI